MGEAVLGGEAPLVVDHVIQEGGAKDGLGGGAASGHAPARERHAPGGRGRGA